VSTEQLSRLLDGDLALAERAAVLDHVAHCPSCAAEQARLVEVSAALRAVPAVAWSDEQTIALLARVSVDPAPVRRARRNRRAPRIAEALVLAATLAGVVALVVAVPVGPLVADALWRAFSWLPPVGATSAPGAATALVVIALVAPLVAYPLARWR
jgi:anti-sigma factor RsiW